MTKVKTLVPTDLNGVHYEAGLIGRVTDEWHTEVGNKRYDFVRVAFPGIPTEYARFHRHELSAVRS